MSCDVIHSDSTASVLLRRSACAFRLLWLPLVLGGASVSAQQTQDPQMKIVLEQQTGSTIRSVNPQHVFETGDLVCFRVRSSSDGFLYVSNRGASGKYTELFPAKGSAAANRIQSGREYRIPAGRRSWFRIEEPPGYETVFFTFTYTPLTSGSGSAPAGDGLPVTPVPSPELFSRCGDASLRARECLDPDAGPSAVPPGFSSRELAIVQSPDGALVSPVSPGDAPIVYEFRIAHR